ncbi:MAG: hypothetical protein KVP17_004297 [Porospora cf. gigantea B]|uniref:uncharacterized protein n=1 Tax=Porospora cf. gigantea B TaxID=2853592 RepID=UPI003571D304|nr:MAG: hypothetical protein KVP17_004297 [Porospora cf. gigantea B]
MRMILQPSSCNPHRIWILSSLLTTGSPKPTEVPTSTSIRASRRRQRLNDSVVELQLLGSTPIPLRTSKLPKWFSSCRALLAPACGEDITPIFSNQIRDLLSELADLIGDRNVFAEGSVAEIMRIALGPAPTPGHVDALSTCPELVNAIGSYSVILKKDGPFTSWDTMKSRLLTAIPSEECKDMLNDSRSAVLVKIVDLMGCAVHSLEDAIRQLYNWFLVDLECFLGTTFELEERIAFVEDFLEVLACFQMPENAAEPYFCRLATCAFLGLEQVHRRIWEPLDSQSSVAGWFGVLAAMSASNIPLSFKPDTQADVRTLRATLDRGLKFAKQIAIDMEEGLLLPHVPSDLPAPGRFLVENGLLCLLTEFEWLNPDGCLKTGSSSSLVASDGLESLIQRAKKEYQKATRLVNLTLKLVTELADEEGIQLPKEEKTRLLQDIAASDRRGVMSRAWESSPIKGSVPPMIVQLTRQSWQVADSQKRVERHNDPIVDFVAAAAKAHPFRPDTYALLFLAGDAVLDHLRRSSRDSSQENIDYEAAIARVETGLTSLVDRLPVNRKFPHRIERLVLSALRSPRPPSVLHAEDALIGLYQVVAPQLGIKASIPYKKCTTPSVQAEFVPPPQPVKRPPRRRVRPNVNQQVEHHSSSEDDGILTIASSPLQAPESFAPLTQPSPSNPRARASFQFEFENLPLTVGTLSIQTL